MAAPTPPAPAQRSCAPALSALAAPGCEVLFADSAATADPAPIWGAVECASTARHRIVGGGDPTASALGAPQFDRSARRLTVFDGDDFYGRRCELGRNDHRAGPTALYREGDRRLTFLSLRLNESMDIDTNKWQTVVQMKQSQPSATGGGAPILELQVYGGRWWLINDWQEIWSAPAATGAWTRLAFDVSYSQDPEKGRVALFIDLNGDGDAADAGEHSPTFAVPTLRRERPGGWGGDGIEPGESVPSHLRTGIYHHPSIDCAGGCSIDVDNVQVLGAG